MRIWTEKEKRILRLAKKLARLFMGDGPTREKEAEVEAELRAIEIEVMNEHKRKGQSDEPNT